MYCLFFVVVVLFLLLYRCFHLHVCLSSPAVFKSFFIIFLFILLHLVDRVVGVVTVVFFLSSNVLALFALLNITCKLFFKVFLYSISV